MEKIVYTNTTINPSPTIVGKAASAIEDVRAKGVKFDANGNIAVASTAGEAVIGVALITNDFPVAAGQDVDIQVKDMGVCEAGGAIVAGNELAVAADGRFVAATEGQFVLGIALENAAEGQLVTMQIAKCYK